MVHSLTYHKNTVILESWNSLRQLKNYESIAGALLYKKYFAKYPSAKKLFGWSDDDDETEDRHLNLQSAMYIKFIDSTVDMLGPDIEMLTEVLEELGEKHYKHYGVRLNMYAPMGEALVEMMEELLGPEKFTSEARNTWLDVWAELTHDMNRCERNERKQLRAQSKRTEKNKRSPNVLTVKPSSVSQQALNTEGRT